MQIAGKSFCFTGSMKHNRRTIEGMVRSKGGRVSHKVTKQCILVAGKDALNPISEKVKDARRLGVRVMTAEEFFAV